MIFRITGKQWLTLLTVQMVTVVFGVSVTSVAVILPQMKGAFSATQDQVSWILTLNLVATAAATPLTGWLAAKLGWRRLMLFTVLGFTAATVACGMARSLETLLFFRVVQGALGAPIFPLGQAILLARFEREHHPMALMMWGVGGVMGPILGPSLGGAIAELLGWRWSFFMIAPLGIAACIPIMLALGDEERGTRRKFDFVGFILIATSVSCLQLVFDRGQREDWFESWTIISLTVIAGTGVYFFVLRMFFASSPLFDLATFRDRNFILGITFAFFMGMLQFTPMVLFPPLLQNLRDYPESVIGVLIAMRGVGNLLSFLVVAPLTRMSAPATLAAGMLIQAGAAVWMGQLDINMTARDVMWTNLIHGFGFGLAYTPMAALAFSTLAGTYLTQGNAIFSLMRMMGSSLFIAIMLVVFVQSSSIAHVNLAAAISPFTELLLQPWTDQFGGIHTRSFRQFADAQIRQQAAMIGYINAFHLLALIPAATAPLVLLFTTVRRR
jgi:MFS transporter, DHA2 family, multidrug resistance protein